MLDVGQKRGETRRKIFKFMAIVAWKETRKHLFHNENAIKKSAQK